MTNGLAYEQASASWLERQGCRLLARNYRCRAGEIDLICSHGELLIFVEVRARSNPRYASAAASIGRSKQRRLRATAAHFLQARWRSNPPPCRFDVVVWEPQPHCGKLRPRWIKNAISDE